MKEILGNLVQNGWGFWFPTLTGIGLSCGVMRLVGVTWWVYLIGGIPAALTALWVAATYEKRMKAEAQERRLKELEKRAG